MELEEFLEQSKARRVYIKNYTGKDDNFFVQEYKDVPLIILLGMGQVGVVHNGKLLTFSIDRFYGAEIEGEFMNAILEVAMASHQDALRMLMALQRAEEGGEVG